MIITDKNKIKQYFEEEKGEDGFNSKIFDANKWSYDLRLGDEVYPTSREHPIILSEQNPYLTIKPGEFALLITHEKLRLTSEVMAFISIRFTYKRKGLINISGFHVDPNYRGRIIFSVYNAGPNDIVLKYKEPVFMIFFAELENPLEGGNKPRSSYDHIETSMISEIKGHSVSLVSSNQRIEQLESSMKLYGAIALAIITTLIGVLLTKGLGG